MIIDGGGRTRPGSGGMRGSASGSPGEFRWFPAASHRVQDWI